MINRSNRRNMKTTTEDNSTTVFGYPSSEWVVGSVFITFFTGFLSAINFAIGGFFVAISIFCWTCTFRALFKVIESIERKLVR